jgi:hypothetical protein
VVRMAWHARGQGFKSPQLHQAQRIGSTPAQGRLSADCQQVTPCDGLNTLSADRFGRLGRSHNAGVEGDGHLEASETFIVWDDDIPAATITISRSAKPEPAVGDRPTRAGQQEHRRLSTAVWRFVRGQSLSDGRFLPDAGVSKAEPADVVHGLSGVLWRR